MIARLKFWLRYWRVRSADMDCRSCCLFCKYFDICSETCYAEWAQLPLENVKSPACGEGLGWSLPVIQFPFDFIDGILSASVVPLCVPFFFAS